MIEIKRYNSTKEFQKLLNSFLIVPSNAEIVIKTGVSKGSISQIMNGKRTPSKNFIEKFKNGFKINETLQIKNPPEDSEGFNLKEQYDQLVSHYVFLVDRLEVELNFERSKNNKT